MSILDKLLGFESRELDELAEHLKLSQLEPRKSILEEFAKIGNPQIRKSSLARLYVGREHPRLSQEIILDTIKCLKMHMPSVILTLVKDGFNFSARLSNRANEKAEEFVALLPELLCGIQIPAELGTEKLALIKERKEYVKKVRSEYQEIFENREENGGKYNHSHQDPQRDQRIELGIAELKKEI